MDQVWQETDGTKCPVEPKSNVFVRFRNGQEAGPAPAHFWRWTAWLDGDSDWDIVAWRLSTLQ